MYYIFHILNKTRIEKLKKSSFELFLDILVKFYGNFLKKVGKLVSLYILKILKRENLSRKYIFKNIDISFLKISFNSENLIEYYRLKNNS